MADGEIPLSDLAAEEEEPQFATFTDDDAWTLGTALVAAARRSPRRWPSTSPATVTSSSVRP